jgi:methanogenic corrinoid protein MtbC1
MHAAGQPQDNTDRRLVAETLRARASELGELFARELAQRRGEMVAQYGPVSQSQWRDNFFGRINDLAAALDAGTPEIFTAQITWSRVAYEARGVPITHLRESLLLLRFMLPREIGPDDAHLAVSFLSDAIDTFDQPPPAPPPRLTADTPFGRTAAEYLLALLEGDRQAACRVVLDAVREGAVSVPDAYLRVLMPVQHELGRMWHLNELSIAEEHFATATTQMLMSQLLPLAPHEPHNGKTILAAAVQSNTHDLGVRVVADFFEMRGWRTVYLGANVPASEIAHGAMDFAVDLVALSAALPTQILHVEETISHLRRAGSNAKVIVGGLGFAQSPQVWEEIGADAYAANLDEALTLGAKLVNVEPSQPHQPGPRGKDA